jgi:hypothetical protein
MARIPLTWYPEPGTWHHSHISNLNGCRIQDARCRIGRVRILATWYPGPGIGNPALGRTGVDEVLHGRDAEMSDSGLWVGLRRNGRRFWRRGICYIGRFPGRNGGRAHSAGWGCRHPRLDVLSPKGSAPIPRYVSGTDRVAASCGLHGESPGPRPSATPYRTPRAEDRAPNRITGSEHS